MRILSSRLKLRPEHLVDCATNPQLAELYGGGSSDICLQSRVGLFSGVGGLLDQALTIGFLVACYFFFKRSANGVVDWIDIRVDDNDEDIDEYSEVASGRTARKTATATTTAKCPQCAGTGHFSYLDDEHTASGGGSTCQLCGGTGSIENLSSRMRNAESFLLPPYDGESDESTRF
jgi:hypothetical protein